VDRRELGSNPDVELIPFQLGATRCKWPGSPPYPAEPFFNGRMQGLRICSGAPTAAVIAMLAR
jgi:hypothetical protein